MSALLSTYERVALVEGNGACGLTITTAVSRLELIKELMRIGSLGGGIIYGDETHLAALDGIEKHVAEVRQQIAAHNAGENDGSCDAS